MFKILNSTTEDVVALKVEGKIQKSDYDELHKHIETKTNDHQKINMYMELENIEGVTPKAALDDVMTYFKYVTDFGKIAVVGEEKWGSLIAGTSGEFYSAHIRFFTMKQKEQAKNWIENKT